jgi:hypothetical protein
MSAQPENPVTLSVPDLPADVDALTAALAYAKGGWYVGPCEQGTKNPGSILRGRWQEQTSRDPEVIVSWFAGTNYGVFLHCGRSGAIVLDDDAPEKVPEAWRTLVGAAPFQSTRESDIARGHHIFAMPPGRRIGNPNWAAGEVRGTNGVIIVAPSVHEKAAQGGRYRWLRGGVVPVLPDDIARTLPDDTGANDTASDATVSGFLAHCVASRMPESVKAPLERYRRDVAAGTGRHPAATTAACWIARDAAIGLYPARDALDTLQAMFTGDFTPTERSQGRRAGRNEWGGIVAWAVGQLTAARVAAHRADVERRMGVDRFVLDVSGLDLGVVSDAAPEGPPSPLVQAELNLPESFWQSRVNLQRIAQAADARMISRDAVLGCILARLASFIPPSVRVETGTRPASLNVAVAIMGDSSAGKSLAMATARDLVPVPSFLNDYQDSLPLGSGEGVAEAYYGWVREETGDTLKDGTPKTAVVHKKVRDHASLYLDEGETLGKVLERSGSTLGMVLRTAWSGGTLGQANASAERKRIVEEGTYALGLVVGWQPLTCGALFSEAAGGTPQRFLFLSAHRGDPPEVRIPMPLPLVNLEHNIPKEDLHLPESAKEELWQASRERTRRDLTRDPLDAHKPLHVSKLAALLTVLDDRHEIGEADWAMAHEVWEVSRKVRTSVVGELADVERRRRAAEDDRAVRVHARSAVAADGALVSAHVARVAARMAEKVAGGTRTIGGRDGLRQALAGRDRAIFTTALDEAVRQGRVVVDGDALRPGEA